MPSDGLSSLLQDINRRSADFQRAERAAETFGISRTVNNSFPRALVLVITELTCDTCHSVTRSPNNCLVRYDKDGLSNSIHYRRIDLKAFLALPRELKVHSQSVPFCESCFHANGD